MTEQSKKQHSLIPSQESIDEALRIGKEIVEELEKASLRCKAILKRRLDTNDR